MGETTNISWTDATFNPWWGCTRVSPGCARCFAETFAKRTGNDVWGANAPRRFFGDRHWNQPLRWNRDADTAGTPTFVFCASMADVFETRTDLDGERARLFDLVDATPALRWLLLTKRPGDVGAMLPDRWEGRLPAHCWIGTTVEDQTRADERIPALEAIDAPVRFLSAEPLLEPVDLSAHLARGGIDWVIVGGESGPRHRRFDPAWARTLHDQCANAGVAYFFKQHGGLRPTSGGDLLDGARHHDRPHHDHDRRNSPR